MYARIAERIKEIVDGLAPSLGIRATGFYGGSSLEGVESALSALPLVLVQFRRADPEVRAATGVVRTERLEYALVVAVQEWSGVARGQAGAATILEGLRAAFNARVEVVDGTRISIFYDGIEIVAVDLPILVYMLFLDVRRR